MALDFYDSSQASPDKISDVTESEEDAFGFVGSEGGRKDYLKSLSFTCLHGSQTRLRQASSHGRLKQIESLHSQSSFLHADNFSSQAGTSSA